MAAWISLLFFCASAAIHASIGVPPTEELMRPTGTLSVWWSSRPKKYSAAEKVPTLSGVQSTQRPLLADCGESALGDSSLKWRMSGKLAATFSAS